MRMTYCNAKLKGVGRVTLNTFGSHEHILTSLLPMCPGILLRAKGPLDADSPARIGIASSFHKAYFAPNEWASNPLVRKMKRLFPEGVDEGGRALAGPAWFQMMFCDWGDEFPNNVDPRAFTDGWLDAQNREGYSVVRDAAAQSQMVEAMLRSDARLEGFAVTTLYDNTELLRNRNTRQKVYLKLFGDGVFEDNTLSLAYENETTLALGLKLYQDAKLDGVLVHTVSPGGVANATKWFERIARATGRRDALFSLQHCEVVLPETLGLILEAKEVYPNFRVSMQPNFFPFNPADCPKDSLFANPGRVESLGVMVATIGADRVDLGTDGMPSSLAFLAAAALLHPTEEGRIDFDTLLGLLTQHRLGGRRIMFDTDTFADALNDMDFRREFLHNPYGEIVKDLHSKVIDVC